MCDFKEWFLQQNNATLPFSLQWRPKHQEVLINFGWHFWFYSSLVWSIDGDCNEVHGEPENRCKELLLCFSLEAFGISQYTFLACNTHMHMYFWLCHSPQSNCIIFPIMFLSHVAQNAMCQFLPAGRSPESFPPEMLYGYIFTTTSSSRCCQ